MYTIVMAVIDNVENHMRRASGIWKSLYPPLDLAINIRLLQKNKSLTKEHTVLKFLDFRN